jgi:hypothetical protein
VTAISVGRPVVPRKQPGPAPRVLPPVATPAAGGREAARVAFSFSPSFALASPVSPAPPPAAALGTTRNIFPPLGPGEVVRLQRRARRRILRDVLWHRSSLDRCRGCGRIPIATGVSMVGNGTVAHYRGLASCGSIWACPPCSAKIRNARALEIAEAAGNWHRAGNTVLMVTFTAPHDLGQPLAALLKTISKSFSSIIAGRPWLRLKSKVPVVGTIRSVEITHGPNGWHPHLHVLVFIEGQANAQCIAQLGIHVRSKWSSFITRAGYRPPSELHGVKIDVCTSAAEAGLYIAKTQDGKSPGNEMARADLKSGNAGHQTPFELLGVIADTGDLAGLPLWHEYEKATKGHQAITWSKGLRKIVNVDIFARTDEELAAEEVGGDLVLEISTGAWRTVTRVLGLEVRLLEAWETGGPDAVIALAAAHGLIPDPDPPGPVPRLISAPSLL